MTAPDLASKLAAAEAKLGPSYTNTVLAGLQIPWPLCTTLPEILDARRAARDAGLVPCLLSAETVAALREWHRNTGPTFTSIPQGLAVAVAESMEADLAAVLETPLLARGPTEARCSCGHPAAYHGAHGCSGEAGWGCGPCLCKEGSTPPPAPAGRDEKE